MVVFGSEELSITVSEAGAEIRSVKNRHGKEFMWQGLKPYWQRTSPVLFPIVGKLYNDSYLYGGKEYKLRQHGFARDLEFEVLEHTHNEVSLRLKYSEVTIQVYPFCFQLVISYKVEGTRVFCNYNILNKGVEDMPYNIGAHPAFNMAVQSKLHFPQDTFLISQRLTDGMRQYQEKIPLENSFLEVKDDLFENDALILCELNSSEICLLGIDGTSISIDRGNMPFLGIWKNQGAPFLCLEPWNGLSNHVNDSGNIFDKEFIRVISPEQVQNLHFSMSFSSRKSE